ncbi:MAG TPA: phage virion morphogenesis protein [Dissulfurispiraceae bacterium]|nr:phage virion morphogenesis protein [Dissulfurispiraceae bacterium]
MSVKVKGLKEIQAKLQKIERIGKQGDSGMMTEVKDEAIDVLLKRTASGRDVGGAPFKPYTDKYAKKKRSSFVNLFLSGKMLGSIKGKATAKQAVIAVEGDQKIYDIALVHNEGGKSGRGAGFKMPKREFFGIRLEAEIKRLRDVMEKWIRKLL